ncbi:MAG TPA: penicillin-binding transpeptidase domain-containing protein [Beijerinckiaceae bacterium]
MAAAALAGSVLGINEAHAGASACAAAVAQDAVCEAATRAALQAMQARGVEAVTVAQKVDTGSFVVIAASEPSRLDAATLVDPLSLAKVYLAASWWERGLADATFESTRGRADAENPAFRRFVTVHEVIVGGSDSAGRQMALALRRAVGADAVIEDLKRFGFDGTRRFWGELSPDLAQRLAPERPVALERPLADSEWAEALSLGEAEMTTSALHVSRFFQAAGNGGHGCPPVARVFGSAARPPVRCVGRPVMTAATAGRLVSALRDTVSRGTARRVSGALSDSGWSLAGKTGTRTGEPVAQQDGWFAGLILDADGTPRFTIATFVRRGGPGGGNAAGISAEVARILAEVR